MKSFAILLMIIMLFQRYLLLTRSLLLFYEVSSLIQMEVLLTAERLVMQLLHAKHLEKLYRKLSKFSELLVTYNEQNSVI